MPIQRVKELIYLVTLYFLEWGGCAKRLLIEAISALHWLLTGPF